MFVTNNTKSNVKRKTSFLILRTGGESDQVGLIILRGETPMDRRKALELFRKMIFQAFFEQKQNNTQLLTNVSAKRHEKE